MPFVIKNKDEAVGFYAGPDVGWVGGKVPPPPTPQDQAIKYDTKEEAEKVIKTASMQATAEEV